MADTFTKQHALSVLRARTGLPATEAEAVLDALLGILADAFAAHPRTELRGFGVFTTRERSARITRNPKTGARVDTPACKTVGFKPGKELKARLNGVTQ